MHYTCDMQGESKAPGCKLAWQHMFKLRLGPRASLKKRGEVSHRPLSNALRQNMPHLKKQSCQRKEVPQGQQTCKRNHTSIEPGTSSKKGGDTVRAKL